MPPVPTFTSLTRSDEIGSHAYLLEFGKTRVVVDAGIHPIKVGYETLPDFEDLTPGSLDAILISHAHLDHLGGLPPLQRDHPEATIVMSDPTKLVGKALLHNSVNVMKAQKSEQNVTEYPLFTHREVDSMASDWVTRRPGQRFRIDPLHGDSPVTCELYPAGHVLGAVAISMSYRDHHILYSGDIHFEDQSLSRAADLPTENIDTLIIETTRGDQARPENYTREGEKLRFGETIAAAFSRHGSVLVPVFALGKTQETLLMLHELMLEGVIPGDTPIHIGGLSTKMTMLTDKIGDSWRRRHPEMKLLEDLPTLRELERGAELPGARPGHIYLYSSGMMTEHTISHRFAGQILPHSSNALLFVGYADPDSPGGKILAADPGDMISLGNRTVPLACEVEKFDFSGHAPRQQLLDYIVKLSPQRAILVHGDTPARNWFAEQLEGFPTEAIVPGAGDKISLT